MVFEGIALLLLVGVGVSAYRAFRTRHVNVARALTHRRVRIGKAREGKHAMVVGQVRAATRQVEAPLSGRPCVYYRLLVEDDSVGREPQAIIERGDGVDFYVEDESGRALVEMAEAEVSLAKEQHPHTAGARLEELAKYSPTQRSSLDYYEGRLEEGDLVAVSAIGRWRTSANEGGSYRISPKQLHLTAPVFVSDRPFAPDHRSRKAS